uniref:Uncharacterized protein n=1 Tax=Physcomitrium patens TaxID=3218 RepID=A0A2K1JKM8_PHYPA|nr:hypothetical protein PHYPA_016908 [Physcomitrium patens]
MVEEEVLGRNQCLLQISNLCISKVKALCLVGMGGIGKTTIAKTTLNNVKHMYDASCFIECDESTSDCYQSLCHILEQLKVEAKPKDLKESQKMLKLFLSRKRVIIVFDNVINQNQIEDVVPMDDLFSMSGSTLIVTTQNGEVMEHCGIELCKINIEELDEETRLRLFITHSCGHEGKLPNELVEVGKKIVKACNGLPLSLKVMGAYLRDKKRLRCWERAFQRLKRGRELDGDEKNSDYKIWNILRVSFDNLRVEEKKMFLDICCFFNNDVFLEGMLKERALRIWSNIEEKRAKEDMEYTLNTLINQSLIKVHKYGVIRVHDQLRDMGRKIVETEIEYTNTRMWNMNEEVSDGINEKLGNLTSLTTLYLEYCSSLTSLPNELGNLTSLTTFDLRGCSRFTSLPNELGNLTSLTTLNMEWCSSLTSLPNELGNLTSLTTLYLEYCSSLTSLLNELGNLTSLTTFDLRGCSRLTSLPNELGNLTSLTTLNMEWCSRLTSLPNELGNLTSLTTLNMEWCSSLTSLPNELGNLTSLTTLNMEWCSSLTSLPNELGNLTSLSTFDLRGCSSLTSLPNELGNLNSLTTSHMIGCSSLTSLPNELDNLTSLTTLKLNGLTSLPIELGNLTSLTTFDIRMCSSLTSLPNELGNLTSLTSLKMNGCKSLTSLLNELDNLTYLTTLSMNGCSSLTSLLNELGNLTSLTTLYLRYCKSLTSLPNKLDNLTCLTTFDIRGCLSLTSFCSSLALLLKELTTFGISNYSQLTSFLEELDMFNFLINF